MREILFRGKCVQCEYNKWVYGYYVNCANKYGDPKKDRVAEIIEVGADRVCCGEYDYFSTYPIISETVGQYTGLTDISGNKIFEGDIVEFTSHGYIPSTERGVVIFKEGSYQIEYLSEFNRKYGGGKQLHRIGSTSKWQDMGASGTITYSYKIIGNIHDNPELLEKEE